MRRFAIDETHSRADDLKSYQTQWLSFVKPTVMHSIIFRK
jgi:hypothetical protein